MPLRDDGGTPLRVKPITIKPIPIMPVPGGLESIFDDVFDDFEERPTLNISRVEQSQDAWCYAACSEMVINEIRGLQTVQQCTVAGFVKSGFFAQVSCCGDPDEDCLTSGCTVGDFAHILGEWKIAFEEADDAVLLSRLQDEFDGRRPVLVRVEWEHVGAHALLVTGVDGTDVHVIDPLEDNPYGGWRPYQELRDGFGEGSWTETWLGLTAAE